LISFVRQGKPDIISRKYREEFMKRTIVDEARISSLLVTKKSDKVRLEEVLAKAELKKGLSVEEAAVLLNCEDPEFLQRIYEAAHKIKNDIYGNRIVLFAPLYITNECANICEYCGFRADNTELNRRTLTHDEIKAEVGILIDKGHKRLLLVYGEHPKFNAKWIADTVESVYSVEKGNNKIRRLNINAAPMETEDFKIIKETGIGTYQCFQETYHRPTYNKMHLKGKKADYDYRLTVHDRALEAGIDDLGIGALFGLYDWKFEILALISHSDYLMDTYGVGPHTISFPRLEPALNSPVSSAPPYLVGDVELKRIVAILRLAIPYTGLILTTRESAKLRKELIQLGVSQISAGSRTYPGAYLDEIHNKPDMQQFTIGDTRSLEEVVSDLAEHGFVPSFCTSCYRQGRTGQTFMDYAKTGMIHKFCQPNAVITFLEYLLDYSSEATKEKGLKLIEKELAALPENCAKTYFDQIYQRILKGDRDLKL
jgi:2-iminoacetate synthase